MRPPKIDFKFLFYTPKNISWRKNTLFMYFYWTNTNDGSLRTKTIVKNVFKSTVPYPVKPPQLMKFLVHDSTFEPLLGYIYVMTCMDILCSN